MVVGIRKELVNFLNLMRMYNIKENFLDDDETWLRCHIDDLWIFDKLIVSKKLGYVCGPHGVNVPQNGKYIVRPCVNLMSMGRGAFFQELYVNDKNKNS